MEDKKITIRFSIELYYQLLDDAEKIGDYFKPGGGINFGKYCRDRLSSTSTQIVKIEGLNELSYMASQLRRIGQNLNQLLNQIHTERHINKSEGGIPDAILNKYNSLHDQYSELKICVDEQYTQIQIIIESSRK